MAIARGSFSSTGLYGRQPTVKLLSVKVPMPSGAATPFAKKQPPPKDRPMSATLAAADWMRW